MQVCSTIDMTDATNEKKLDWQRRQSGLTGRACFAALNECSAKFWPLAAEMKRFRVCPKKLFAKEPGRRREINR